MPGPVLRDRPILRIIRIMSSRKYRPHPHDRRVTATEAAKNFGELVSWVREANMPYVVERQGRPIAQISPMGTRRCTLGDLATWFERRRSLDDGYTSAVLDHVKQVNRPRVPAARWQP